jgi:mycofactocin system FadH/OYE family oxidoreductase 2
MEKLTHLFSPISIGNVNIRNRIVQSAHITGFAENGLFSDRHVRYYEARAKGGIGLIITEAVVTSPNSDLTPRIISRGYMDEMIPRFKKVTNAIHAHGAKAFCQLAHGGSIGTSFFNWRHIESCSAIPSPGMGEVPAALDENGIRRVIQDHVDLALRAKEGGYDGIELHFGHGYLHQQFLSPLTNVREDAYGGDLENRMRFTMEIIDAVRKAVGDDFVVGLRSSSDELIPGGFTLEDAKQFIPIWEATGKIDYLNITVAACTTMTYAIPPMMVPPRPFVYCAAEIRQHVDIPVFAVIRINDPVMANDIIKNGEADMVIMTRANICDPELSNKAKEGRLDEIRQCIACNEGCWERLLVHQEGITCMQNPEAGREGSFKISPSQQPKKVMVVGGGCAGMKAATIAKQRGHQVSLYEKADELGGAIMIAANAPSRQELSQTVRYLTHEIDRLGVDVHLGKAVSPETVLAENPDVLIVATGATTISDPNPQVVGPQAAMDIEPGAHVVTAEDVLSGKVETGQQVIIADKQHYIKGLMTAEFLADQGKCVGLVMPQTVRYVTPNPYDMDHITLGVQMFNLKTKKVRLIADKAVKKVRKGKVVLQDIFTEEQEELEADTLVLSYWRQSDRKLYEELQDKVKEIYCIGDALSPRRLINAIYEGYTVAAKI